MHVSHFSRLPQYFKVAGEKLEIKTPAFYDYIFNFFADIFSQKNLTDRAFRNNLVSYC